MDRTIAATIFVLLYGVSYGLVLFTISIGLAITMGLMRVMNLAHGAFAAIGGYLAIALMNQLGLPFLAAVAAAVITVAALSVVLERLIYAHLYARADLDQVLMTLGLNFIVIGALTLIFGPNVYPVHLPPFLQGSVDLGFRTFETYRIFLIVVGSAVVLLLWLILDRTKFGARLRAAVDNRGMAQAIGIDVDRLFIVAFALGSGLAALGGAVGAAMLPLEPLYPLKYLVLVLVVVSLSGLGNIKGTLAIAIFVGIADTAGRFLVPDLGGFVIYVVLIVLMTVRRGGLFQQRGVA